MAANGHGTKRFCLGINISMEAKVKTDEIASQEGITRSELIRRALYQFLQGRGLSTQDLQNEVETVAAQTLHLVEQGADTTPIKQALGGLTIACQGQGKVQGKVQGGRRGRPAVSVDRAAVIALIKEGWAQPKIAEHVGVSVSTLSKYGRQWGIQFPDPRKVRINLRRVAALRRTGRTYKEIAAEMGVSESALYKAKKNS